MAFLLGDFMHDNDRQQERERDREKEQEAERDQIKKKWTKRRGFSFVHFLCDFLHSVCVLTHV